MKPVSRLIRLLSVAALLFPAAAAAQQTKPYVDPLLRMLLPREAGGVRGNQVDLQGAARAVAATAAVDFEGAGGEARVGTLMEVRDLAAIDALRAAGAEVGTAVRMPEGTYIVTARIPLSGLATMAQSDRVVRIEAARKIKVENDSGVRAIHADQLRQQAGGEWTGLAGQGVVVGIYDTGIDFTHPDFITPAGQTRLLGLWDQWGTGTPPAGYGYGNYCSPAAIQTTIDGAGTGCSEEDIYGHGTHVAGTAAGNGSATTSGGSPTYQFAGVAPAADLLVVRGSVDGYFDDDRIVDGVTWLRRTAQAMGKRVVINLSLGSVGGPADGTGLVERRLDAEADSGAVIVVAAGNSGANNNTTPPTPPQYVHASKLLASGGTAELKFTVPAYGSAPGNCNDEIVFDVWYPGSDQYDLTIERPDGGSVTATTGQYEQEVNANGNIAVDNASGGLDPANHDRNALIVAADCPDAANAPVQGTWTVRMTARNVASGQPIHAWVVTNQVGGLGSAQMVSGFDNRYEVGGMATAKNVITVGAYVTRNSWTAQDGKTHGYTHPSAIGDLAEFSSAGPTRDGRVKPEITAPGEGIASAFSSTVAPQFAPIPITILPDRKHFIDQGTSMATPFVTGAAALLLQKDSTLTPAQVKQILTSAAAHDAFTDRIYDVAGSPTDWWGYGKLDVKAAADALGADVTQIVTLTLAPHTDTLPTNATSQLTATPRNYLGNPLPATVTWSSTSPSVATVDANGLVRALRTGRAFIVAEGGGKRDSAAVVVVPPATLAVGGTAIAASRPVRSSRGTRIPLLDVTLQVNGYEDVKVQSLAFDVTGRDAGARLVALRDANSNGLADASDPVLGSAQAQLTGGTARVVIPFDTLHVAAKGSASVLVALETSGDVPNGTAFEATLVPEATHTLDVRSLATDLIDQATSTAVSASLQTTVLQPDEVFALSENPVRSRHVIFNFSTRPTVAGIYALTGRRVVDLAPRIAAGDGRVDWDLTNDDGSRVAAGVYLVVFTVDGQVVRRKLFIMPGATSAGSEE